MNTRKTALVAATLLIFTNIDSGPSAVNSTSFGFVRPAGAVIGRPLTPVSYAGVARRTTRRVVGHTGVAIAALPPGCIYGPYYGAYYYRCGANYYAKSGGVYVQVIVQ